VLFKKLRDLNIKNKKNKTVLLKLILLNYKILAMKNVFLGIGSNIDDRIKNLEGAMRMIEEIIGPVKSVSSVYETEPWGFKSDNDFLNMVLLVNTDLLPSVVLGRILMIEAQLGRIRDPNGYVSRNIDIDILFFNNALVNEKSFVIPHPKLHERRFVLVPLAEIDPEYIHPVLNKSIKELLAVCNDKCRVNKFR
jgi:2-amino-4-hydroxy-6-hydroxymethyldihydropteridine diphosphokinase